MLITPLLALAALVAAQAPPFIDITIPDSIVQCQATLISWTNAKPPVSIIIYPSEYPDSTALADLGSQSGTSVTWIANIQAGISVHIMVTDSTGATAISKATAIQPGSAECLGSGNDDEGAAQTSSPVGTGGSLFPTVSPNAASSNAKVGLSGLLGLAAVVAVV